MWREKGALGGLRSGERELGMGDQGLEAKEGADVCCALEVLVAEGQLWSSVER